LQERQASFSVPAHKTRERIDQYLARELPDTSRSQIQKWIKNGLVLVDGEPVKVNHVVRPHERIDVRIPKPPPPDIVPETIPLRVVYEDKHLMVIDKPAGMVVHPAYGHSSGTLVHALLGYGSSLSNENAPDRPGIVHRLDKDTSGLLVVAKDDAVHRGLAAQFSDKTIWREYAALVWGIVRASRGTIDTGLARNLKDRKKISVSQTGKKAVTHYLVEKRYSFLTLLTLKLETGRTHQIRVHLAHLGHPVFGDPTYGGRNRPLSGMNRDQAGLAAEMLEGLTRQALHAKTLGFIHPVTKQTVRFDSELPEDIQNALDLLNQRDGVSVSGPR
jgi:23S rRNA pseudouridine1911/1915/1917 synthase